MSEPSSLAQELAVDLFGIPKERIEDDVIELIQRHLDRARAEERAFAYSTVQIGAARRHATEVERERCAQIAEKFVHLGGKHIAEAIRKSEERTSSPSQGVTDD